MATDINNQLVEEVFNLMRELKGEMNLNGAENELTLHQLQVISFIEKNKKVKMTDVADRFQITTPSATSLINTLAKKGYIKRTADEADRRTVFVSLAPRTEEYIKKINALKAAKITSLLSFLSDDDKKQLLKIVVTMFKD